VNVNECLMLHCRTEVYEHGACCDDCWNDRRNLLAALPDLYVMTYAMLTPGSRQQEINTIHVPAIDPAAPINLVAHDTLELGYARLSGWAVYASQRAGKIPPDLKVYTSGRGFLTVVQTLLAYDHKLALGGFAGSYVMDVWTAYRRLVVQCVSTEPRHLEPPCPDCGAATLITRHADEYAMCLTCGNRWPHSQLPKLRRQAQRMTA